MGSEKIFYRLAFGENGGNGVIPGRLGHWGSVLVCSGVRPLDHFGLISHRVRHVEFFRTVYLWIRAGLHGKITCVGWVSGVVRSRRFRIHRRNAF